MTFDPNAAAPGESGAFGLLNTPDDAGVVLVPVPFEATVSYGGGASEGPAAILRASRQVDLYDVETGKPYEAGIAMLDDPADVRAWDIAARAAASHVIAQGGIHDDPALRAAAASVDSYMERMNGWVRTTVDLLLGRGKMVGTIGGDHSVSFGAIEAHARRHPGMGLLHVDAHADLRDAYEGFTWSHASILHNVMARIPAVSRLVQVGIRDLCEEEADGIAASNGRILTFFDAELSEARFAGETWAAQVGRMIDPLPREVYITFDIDGLDPALCPHTGTKVPGGLSFQMATSLIAAVARSGRRIVGFDLTEVVPAKDDSEWDENVGARLLYKLIGWTLKSRS
ncbi:MAG: agmatinase family protein [Myxococcales bacterium]